jgi:predicted metalloprotease
VGHHVQTLRGAPLGSSPDVTLRRELQAECFAGVWAAASGVPLPPVWAYGEDAAHGTREQQIRWLNRGYSHARPADCDGIWAGAPL